MQSTDDDPRLLFGAFLRARTDGAKDLARRIGCDHRTAENYRAGRYWPPARLWPAIISAFGQDVTDAVFHPTQAAARLHREIAARRREIERLESALQSLPVEARSFAPGLGAPVAAAAAETT